MSVCKQVYTMGVCVHACAGGLETCDMMYTSFSRSWGAAATHRAFPGGCLLTAGQHLPAWLTSGAFLGSVGRDTDLSQELAGLGGDRAAEGAVSPSLSPGAALG